MSCDQYTVDADSRYPDFSDYHAHSVAGRQPLARSFESKFQVEQQKGLVHMHNYGESSPPGPQMQMHYGPAGPIRGPPLMRETVQERVAALGGEKMTVGPLSSNDVMTFMMFLIIVALCYCMKAVIELRAEVKALRRESIK